MKSDQAGCGPPVVIVKKRAIRLNNNWQLANKRKINSNEGSSKILTFLGRQLDMSMVVARI